MTNREATSLSSSFGSLYSKTWSRCTEAQEQLPPICVVVRHQAWQPQHRLLACLAPASHRTYPSVLGMTCKTGEIAPKGSSELQQYVGERDYRKSTWHDWLDKTSEHGLYAGSVISREPYPNLTFKAALLRFFLVCTLQVVLHQRLMLCRKHLACCGLPSLYTRVHERLMYFFLSTIPMQTTSNLLFLESMGCVPGVMLALLTYLR